MTERPAPGRAEESLAREVRGYRDRKERSVAARIALVGSLGWLVVVPALLGTWAGHALDVQRKTGVFWTGAGVFAGAFLGFLLLSRALGRGGNP